VQELVWRLPALATALGEPALAEPTTLVLGVAAPDTSLLVRLEGVLEAGLLDGALAADALRLVDQLEGVDGGPHGEEEAGFGITTEGKFPPVGSDHRVR